MYEPYAQQPAPAPKKPWYKKKRYIAGIAVGVLIVGAAASGGEETSDSKASSVSGGARESAPKVPSYAVVQKDTEGNQRQIVVEVTSTKGLRAVFDDVIGGLNDDAGYFVHINCSTGGTAKMDNRLANGRYAVGNMGSATTGLEDGESEFEPNSGRTCPADDPLKDTQESNKEAQDDLQDQIDEASKEAEAPEQDVEPVPDVVGMSVADAISTLHGAGYMADEESISPGNTFIIMNSNWKVCSQDPGPGATDDIRVTIYAVKMHESC